MRLRRIKPIFAKRVAKLVAGRTLVQRAKGERKRKAKVRKLRKHVEATRGGKVTRNFRQTSKSRPPAPRKSNRLVVYRQGKRVA